jgi:hypothetical protein
MQSPARRLTNARAVTATRIVVKGATHAVTRRTTFRKAFLAPWDPRVEQCWLYALADAQRLTRVAVHHGVRVITHHHVSITLTQENLGSFLRRFHGEASCAINALLAEEKYDAPRSVFDKRTAHSMRLLDAAAQASHLSYEHLNPVAAGLVARPEHMQGRVLGWSHWKSGGLWVERPDVYFDPKERPERLWLELTPPPLLMQAFDCDLDALIHHMRRVCEDGVRALRDARRRPPMGAQKVQRLHPWTEPKTLAEPGGRAVPSFKIGARGLVGRKQKCAAAREVRTFRGDHEGARQQRLAGQPAVFPHGTYGMRVFHGVEVASPRPDAIVAQPGPLLHEVVQGARSGARVQVLDEVRAAWADEASEVVAMDELDFASAAAPQMRAEPSAGSDAPEEHGATEGRARREAEVHYRRHRDSDDGADHARRLIIERDRRRGRPTKKKPGGSDPPS